MVLLILSDSHGNIEMMREAVDRTGPDAIIHLGDSWRDGQQLKAQYPDIPLYQVPGNWDEGVEAPRELTLELEGHRVFLCHGDRYGARTSLAGLGAQAKKMQIDLLLYGHTHRPYKDLRDGTLFLNPGSIGAPNEPGAYSYAVAFLMPSTPISAWLKLI